MVSSLELLISFLLSFINLLFSAAIFLISYFAFLIFKDFSEELTEHISKNAKRDLKKELLLFFHSLRIMAVGFFFFALHQALYSLDLAGILSLPILLEVTEFLFLLIVFYGIFEFWINLMKLKKNMEMEHHRNKKEKR